MGVRPREDLCAPPNPTSPLGLYLQGCLRLPWQQSEMQPRGLVAWTLPLPKRRQCPAQVLPLLLQFGSSLDSKASASEPLPHVCMHRPPSLSSKGLWSCLTPEVGNLRPRESEAFA